MKNTRGFIVLILAICGMSLFLPSCRSSAPKVARAHRLVLVSFDGLGEELLEDWLNTPGVTTGEGLAGMAEKGLKAQRVRMVNPTLTAVNHVSLITGAAPAQTGIVSNSFHIPGEALVKRHSGFTAPLGAPTLWERARKAGIRTGILLWPAADGKGPERSGDFGITWPDRALIWPGIHELRSQEAIRETELSSSDGLQTQSWTVGLGREPRRIQMEVAAFDGTPDGRPRFDSIAVRLQGEEEWRFIADRDWFEIRQPFLTKSGADSEPATGWCRILHLDHQSGDIRLYNGEFNTLSAYPQSFKKKIEEIAGPWPGTPDGRNIGEWWLDDSRGIDLDTYIEEVERLDRYLDKIAVWVMEHEDFGFLIAYHPSPDEYEHAGLIREPSQWAYSEGRAFAANQAMERVGRSTDRSAATLWSGIDPTRDTLVVLSDHGHMPIHSEVLINRALADAGLVTTVMENGRESVAADSPMVATCAGACAHIYLNLRGREEGGFLSEDEGGELLRKASRVLADLNLKGEAVVEKIFSHDELGPLGLLHPNSGDLVVFLNRGYTATSRLDGKSIRPSRYYGQHGYLNHYDALCGIFMARGGPVRPGELREISALDIAPRIARWLGIR